MTSIKVHKNIWNRLKAIFFKGDSKQECYYLLYWNSLFQDLKRTPICFSTILELDILTFEHADIQGIWASTEALWGEPCWQLMVTSCDVTYL